MERCGGWFIKGGMVEMYVDGKKAKGSVVKDRHGGR